jgi:hypothetical protein
MLQNLGCYSRPPGGAGLYCDSFAKLGLNGTKVPIQYRLEKVGREGRAAAVRAKVCLNYYQAVLFQAATSESATRNSICGPHERSRSRPVRREYS